VPWSTTPDAGLSTERRDIADHWFMLDAAKGDTIGGGIHNKDNRLDPTHKDYAPFGTQFPMKLLEFVFDMWPRCVFEDVFIPASILERGPKATRDACSERLKRTFAGVFEPDFQMSLHTGFDPECFLETSAEHRGGPIRVVCPAILAAMDVLMRAGFQGQTLSKAHGSAHAIQEEHIARERMFARHWKAWRHMWTAYYVGRAAELAQDASDCESEGEQAARAGSQAQAKSGAGAGKAEAGADTATPVTPRSPLTDEGVYMRLCEPRYCCWCCERIEDGMMPFWCVGYDMQFLKLHVRMVSTCRLA